MPYIPFTEEQKIAANSVDLADFLRLRGEKLESAGREHKLVYYDGSGKGLQAWDRFKKELKNKERRPQGCFSFSGGGKCRISHLQKNKKLLRTA